MTAVLLALSGLILPAAWPAGRNAILAALPILILPLWVHGVRAIQLPTLGRLGDAGAWAAMAGLAGRGGLNLLRAMAAADASASWGALLDTTPLTFAGALAATLIVWGVLALGTASLNPAILPRGSTVLWVVGVAGIVIAPWPPVALAAMAGIAWSSLKLLRARPAGGATETAGYARAGAGANRLVPLDALRGTIMALMAIDHASYFVRRWHPFETWDQPLPAYPSIGAMLTRLATHPCAPGFFFLMGAGMVLFAQSRRRAGWQDRRIAKHLALRGLLFIGLEQLIVDLATGGHVNPLDFSILAGLGGAMLLGIPFVRLNGKVQATVGSAIVLAMQILPGWLLDADLGLLTPVRLLLLPGSVGAAFVLYPPVPWLGLALLGMAFAGALQSDPKRAYRLALMGGILCLACFPLLRALGGFGNLRLPPSQDLIGFFNVVKYPPSLSFLLLALGFDLLLLGMLGQAARWLATAARPLVTLGQAALYFFLAHWFVYAVLGSAFPNPGSLPATYLVWALGLVALYPICRAYEAFKRRTSASSVWRMV